MAYGVTDEGFILKRTADIIADLETELSARFPGIDTSGESVAGNLTGVFAAAIGQAWEVLQMANNQYDPLNVRGANQSALVLINGIVRIIGETDQELRERRNNVTFTPATSIIESIYANLLNLENVDFIRAYQNVTGVTDSRGITSHSVAVVIVGGDDTDIAEIIFNHIPAGINTYGTTEEILTDTQGFTYPIRFTRPTEIPMYVDIEIETDDEFPVDGIDQMKQAIIDYAAGGADAIGGTRGNLVGFPPGADVLISRLYTPINSIPGNNATQVKVGDSPGTVAEIDYDIEWNEVSTWDINNIDITVVG